jgi:hypothetical protein
MPGTRLFGSPGTRHRQPLMLEVERAGGIDAILLFPVQNGLTRPLRTWLAPD